MKKIIDSIKSLKWYESIMCIVMICISVYYAIQPQEGMPQWLAIINLISGICGVVCVFLCAKANRMNFLFATINTIVFAIYLWYFGIWATFWLEALVYFPLNIVSWICWYKHKDNDNELLAKSKKLSLRQNIIVFAAIVLLDIIVHYCIMSVAGDSWVSIGQKLGLNVYIMQWLDSTIFAIGIIATILELLRYSEQYVLWIITDVVAVLQYAIKKDPVYTTKKTIYLIEAFIGLKNWRFLNKKNKENR